MIVLTSISALLDWVTKKEQIYSQTQLVVKSKRQNVSRYTVGVFEEGAINVAVNQVGVFPCKFVDLI
jgi:hypothetical protein